MAVNERTEAEARRNLQRYLRHLSYFDPDITAPPIDGNPGETTTEAIRSFQRKYNLPVTGVADRDTWDAIYAAYRLSQLLNIAPYAFSPFPRQPADYTVKRGDTGYLVLTIQYLLGEISMLYDSALKVAQTGVYDEQTEAAIRDIQARTMLPVTGETDKQTWNMLVRLYNRIHQYTEP